MSTKKLQILGSLIPNDVVYADDTTISSTTAPVNADTLGGRNASEYATNAFVTNKIAEAQLGGGSGSIDLSGYATKDELHDAIEDVEIPVDSVNGKTGAVELTAEDVGAAPISIDTARGNVVAVSNSGDLPLHGLTLYGKTTQNGTPTPENPVELVSVGDDGSVDVTICGKNLIKPTGNASFVSNGITYTKNADGSVSVSGTASSNTYYIYKEKFPAGTYIVSGAPSGSKVGELDMYVNAKDIETGASIKGSIARDADDAKHLQQFTLEQYCLLECVMRVGSGKTVDAIFYPMIRPASIADNTYEPYKEAQTFPVFTHNNLMGIPVSSGGNYTDENGQQWICDEIDFARGVYVKRVHEFVLDDTAGMDISVEAFDDYSRITFRISDFKSVSWETSNGYYSHGKFETTYNGKYPHAYTSVTWVYIIMPTDIVGSKASEVKAYFEAQKLAGTPVSFQYILATPIETDLSAEELSAYATLHTNYPNTTIYNDGGADMDISYFTPDASVPMNIGSGAKGKVLGVDEHGCVAPMTVEQIGAHPNTWLPTIAQIGAAPSGFGLGGESAQINVNDIDNTTNNGWYRFATGGTFAGISANYGLLWCIKYTDNMLYQFVYLSDSNSTILSRQRNSGNWKEWKQCNPSAFAPAGYGLGDRANYPENNDVHSISKSGWYLVGVSTQNAVGTYGLIQANVYDAENAVLFLYSNTGSIYTRKIKQYGTWSEWEYVNPPMALGVEYRTTERWQGKVVYTKLIDFGVMPNATTGYVYNVIPVSANVISLKGIAKNGYGNDDLSAMNGVTEVWRNQGYIAVKTTADLSAYTATFLVKYTKD